MVRWSKDGESVEENEHFCIEEEGAFRSLVILSAELSDTGEYACRSKDDNIAFNITVKGAHRSYCTTVLDAVRYDKLCKSFDFLSLM